METGIHNTSEIGRLKRVMLHRPGGELENLMPEYLERLLFDDIPYLREAQREHDAFADCLRDFSSFSQTCTNMAFSVADNN